MSESDDRPTVALVGPSPEATPGGMATVLREILTSEILRAGVTVRASWSHSEGSSARKALFAIRALLRLLFGQRPSVVHIHVASGWSVERKALMVLAARIRGIPVLLHLHGADMVGDLAEGSRRHSAIFRWCARYSARVIVLSEYWAQWMREIEPQAETVVVRNAVPILDEWQPFSPEPTVLFLGRLGDRKGIWTLLRAVERAVSSVPQMRIVIAGDGEVQAVRAWLGERPEVQSRTELLGWVHPSDVPALIDRAWVLALPSRNEGLPMSVLEAMARGRAIIATNVGGIPDAVRNSVDGLLCEPDDDETLALHLVTLLSDRPTTELMGRAARARVAEGYDLEQSMRKTLSIYEEVRSR